MTEISQDSFSNLADTETTSTMEGGTECTCAKLSMVQHVVVHTIKKLESELKEEREKSEKLEKTIRTLKRPSEEKIRNHELENQLQSALEEAMRLKIQLEETIEKSETIEQKSKDDCKPLEIEIMNLNERLKATRQELDMASEQNEHNVLEIKKLSQKIKTKDAKIIELESNYNTPIDQLNRKSSEITAVKKNYEQQLKDLKKAHYAQLKKKASRTDVSQSKELNSNDLSNVMKPTELRKMRSDQINTSSYMSFGLRQMLDLLKTANESAYPDQDSLLKIYFQSQNPEYGSCFVEVNLDLIESAIKTMYWDTKRFSKSYLIFYRTKDNELIVA